MIYFYPWLFSKSMKGFSSQLFNLINRILKHTDTLECPQNIFYLHKAATTFSSPIGENMISFARDILSQWPPVRLDVNFNYHLHEKHYSTHQN